jgi:PAS domain S-box-containing protein
LFCTDIEGVIVKTDQEVLTNQMEASQIEFELLIKQSPVAITLLEGEALILRVVNDTALQLIGKTEQEVKNRSLLDIIPELTSHFDTFRSVFETGIPYVGNGLEIKFQKNGKEDTGYYDLNFKPWHGSDGNIKGVMVVCVDVSENIRSKRKIEERERLYEAITQNTPDLIYVFDLDKRFTYANEALLKMWGLSWEESKGKSLLEIGYEPWHAEMHEREIDEIIINKKPIRGEVSFPHATLGDRVYDYILVPVINQLGNVESIAGTTRDITELKNTQKDLRESEEHFRTFGNNIQNLAWIADGDGDIFWYNQRWMDYTGLTFDEMKGWGWQKVHHPDHVDRIVALSKIFWKSSEPFELTFPLRRHDGEYRWFLTKAAPITDESGRTYRWIGTNTDIHDSILATEKLKESEQRYNSLIFSSPSGIGLLSGEDFIITTANEPMIEILGRGKEIIGRKYFDALPELEEQGFKEVFTQVYTTGIPYNAIESPVWLVKNGVKKLKYFNFILYPQRNINNEVEGIGIIATEVTTQALLNNKIKESEKRFSMMVKQAPVAICVLKGENHVVEIANEKQLELWGITEAEILNKPLFKAIPEGAGQGFEQLLSDVLQTGNPCFVNELAFTLTRNGTPSTSYVNFVYNPLFNAQGGIAGIVSVATDVTEQVIARKKAEQSEEKYKSLIAAAPMGIGVFVGRDLVIENPNESFIKVVGKGPDIEGKRLIEVMPELVQHGQPYLKILDDVFTTGKMYQSYGDPVIIEQQGELNEGYYDINYVPLFDENGEVYAILDIAIEVTEKIKSQHKIEESEKRFRSLADDSPIFVYIIEPSDEAFISYWNKTWLDYTGQSLEEALGRSWDRFIHPDDIPVALEIYMNAFKNREPFLLHAVRTKHHSGEYRWFSYKGIPRYLPDGTFIGFVGVGFDVHQQVIGEILLKEREEKFRSLVQTLPQLVWVTDADGNAEFASFRWKEYTGIEPTGEKEWKEIVHPDDYERLNESWSASRATGKLYAFDVRLKSKTGDYRWFTVVGEPVMDEENNIVKWVGAFTDNHDEKTFTQELEETVASRTAELKESEDKFFRLFNLSPVCKTLSEIPSGKIVMVNDVFSIVFGFSQEEAISKTAIELGMIGPESREVIVKELKTKGKIRNKEIELVKKDGEKIITLTSAEIINIGTKHYILSAFSDITDRKNAEKNIVQKNIELEKLNKELQSFAYISSHDLQEPLRKIQTFASRIVDREYDTLSERGKDNLKRMQDAAKRMQTLIQDLLAYSRTNATDRKFESTDLNDIMNEVKEELTEELKEKNTTIETNELCHANIIPFQFRQLLNNLISNSLKFSNPENPPIIKIHSEIESGSKLNNEKLLPEKKYCHISVSDNGIGFEPQYSEKIFEVFQRLHGKEEYKGTGIGLSIVKKIVDNHDGIITATSELNEGATFDIYIPA